MKLFSRECDKKDGFSHLHKLFIMLACVVMIVSGILSFFDATKNLRNFTLDFYIIGAENLLLILWGITALFIVFGSEEYYSVKARKRMYRICLIFALAAMLTMTVCVVQAVTEYPFQEDSVIAYTGIPEYYISFIGQIILVGVICFFCLYGIRKNKQFPEWLKQATLIISAVLVIESVYSFFWLPADLFVLLRFGFHIVLVKIAHLIIFMGIFKKNRMVETLSKQDIDLSCIQNP